MRYLNAELGEALDQHATGRHGVVGGEYHLVVAPEVLNRRCGVSDGLTGQPNHAIEVNEGGSHVAEATAIGGRTRGVGGARNERNGRG